MAQYMKKFKSISKSKVAALTAIYSDYLYMVREHELLLKYMSPGELAMQKMGILAANDACISWGIDGLSAKEKQEFIDFMNNDVSENENHAFVTLRHIKSNEDKFKPKRYAIPPYEVASMNMPLPSSIERFSIFYPMNEKMGDIEFLIDGEYKIYCTDKKAKDMSISDFLLNHKELCVFYIYLNVANGLIKNGGMGGIFFNILNEKFADENIATNENNILELINSFTERLLDICRQRYNCTDRQIKLAFERAYADGLIKSVDTFVDCIRLRHFMRHQWDTLDELGTFTPKQAEENKRTRNLYIGSYLKLCDKPLKQRMQSYIEILHQMQHVIASINPDWKIRDDFESDNDFFQRIKSDYCKNPKSRLSTELNYPLYDDKYIALNNYIHENLPNIRIADEFPDRAKRQAKMEDYSIRSDFLQNFNTIECQVMRHCRNRGENLDKQEAWETIEKLGVILPEETQTWKQYSRLRNLLSHNYFSNNLRYQLLGVMDNYQNDLMDLQTRIMLLGPDVIQLQNGVLEYQHYDGLDVELDYNNHTITFKNVFQNKNDRNRINLAHKEKYPGGIEFDVYEHDIVGVKLPSGVHIDVDNRSLDFGNGIMWRTDDEHLDGFFTEKSKILTNKNLRVVECREKGVWQPFEKSDDFLIENKHAIRIDSKGFLKRITIRNTKNNTLQLGFMRVKDEHNLMLMNDGTIISQNGEKMIILHDGYVLNFKNRCDFAMSYITPKNIIQQNFTTTHSR